ncbi:MAG: hypothetical protein QXX35_01320 [Desulfurococcaceae archaeon]|uniref:Uncharacterized protein n=1 Tax=Staphylothermus marinus TaxID=2280 RepID=A0A7C4D810_STAMA
MSEEKILSKTTREFIISLLSLLPSRNYIVQILRILYETGGVDIDTYRQIYRGIVDEYAEDILRKLGVVVEKNIVKLKYMSIGWNLASLYDDLFNILYDGEFRKRLSEASNLEIPDPLEEWIYIRIDTLLKDPVHGDNARIVLRELSSRKVTTVQELVTKGLNIGEAYTIADILQTLGLAEHIDGTIRLSPLLSSRMDCFRKALMRLNII